MIVVQIGIIIFLLIMLGLICQDEYKKRHQARKSAKLDRFWKINGERRKTMRINIKIDVIYEVISRGTAAQHTLSRNISLGGVNLALKEKLLPGTLVSLQLNIPGRTKPIFAQGRTIWVREIYSLLEEKFFATGIEFIQISPRDKTDLLTFINQHLESAQSKIHSLLFPFI